MSLVEAPPTVREPDTHSNTTHAQPTQGGDRRSYRDSLPNAPHLRWNSEESLEDPVLKELYADEQNTMMASQKTAPAVPAPALPKKSALRASRLLELNTLKLPMLEPTLVSASPTPHDMYLSSEEDVSSSADEYSDYDLQSSSEESEKSPVRRGSHEDTAKMVSVVFVGKPSVVELPRRSTSPTSTEASQLSSPCYDSPVASIRRRESRDSVSSSSFQHPARNSSLLPQTNTKPQPAFLNLDPFANGSTYSLETPTDEPQISSGSSTSKTTRNHAAMFRGLARTVSLVRKRSRPTLNTNLGASPSKDRVHTTITETPVEQELPEPAPAPEAGRPVGQHRRQESVTYNDIIRMAKKNAKSPPPPSTPQSPMSPSKKGLFNKRRSMKITSRMSVPN